MNKKTIGTVLIAAGVFLAAGVVYRFAGGLAPTSANASKACQDDCDKEKPGAEKTAEHAEHEGHEAAGKSHDSHGHGEEKCVALTEDQMKKFGVRVAAAGPGTLQVHLSLPGEVTVNADRVAHVIPRVPGVVREVRKNLGDKVTTGEIMAALDSRDLADAKASFLAARERVALARTNFDREEQLWTKKVSAQQEYLQAKQALAEVKIELRTAEQKLHALGFSEKYLADLPTHQDVEFTRYEMSAPFDGTVIEKHISLGEMLKDDSEAFMIADLSSVWVNLNIHQSDLPLIRPGQPVTISAGPGIPDARATLSYVGAIIDEKTRTTPLRVVLANPSGVWRPGLFVTGRITVEDVRVPLRVAKDAVLLLDGKPSVFVKVKDEFEPQPVTTGRVNATHIEVVSGLAPGQIYVDQGAYILKLEMNKFKGDPCSH